MSTISVHTIVTDVNSAEELRTSAESVLAQTFQEPHHKMKWNIRFHTPSVDKSIVELAADLSHDERVTISYSDIFEPLSMALQTSVAEDIVGSEIYYRFLPCGATLIPRALDRDLFAVQEFGAVMSAVQEKSGDIIVGTVIPTESKLTVGTYLDA